MYEFRRLVRGLGRVISRRAEGFVLISCIPSDWPSTTPKIDWEPRADSMQVDGVIDNFNSYGWMRCTMFISHCSAVQLGDATTVLYYCKRFTSNFEGMPPPTQYQASGLRENRALSHPRSLVLAIHD